MLCSHSVRDGPRIRYAERGATTSEMRSHLAPAFRRSRNVHGATSEIPITSPKMSLSRCHPIAAPGAYSVTSACTSVSGRDAGEVARAVTEREQPRRHRIGLAKRLGRELVAPAERDDAPLPDEAVKFELTKRQRTRVLHDRLLVVARDHVGRVAKSVRVRGLRREHAELIGHGAVLSSISCTTRRRCLGFALRVGCRARIFAHPSIGATS